MAIWSGKVELVQKGVTYDLAKVHLLCVTISFGIVGEPIEERDCICKIPVEQSEIIARLKQAEGKKLPLEVDESEYPLVTTTGLGVETARLWLKQSLCEHSNLEFKGLSNSSEEPKLNCFQCTECRAFIYRPS